VLKARTWLDCWASSSGKHLSLHNWQVKCVVLFLALCPGLDQERIQNLSAEFETWTNLAWEVTEKLDGASMTVYVYDDDVGVCSRNLNLRDTDSNTLWQVAHREQIITAILDSGRDLAVQGELVGEGIQGNPYRLRGQNFYVFDIYDIRAGHYLLPAERREFCEQHELAHVPRAGTHRQAGGHPGLGHH